MTDEHLHPFPPNTMLVITVLEDTGLGRGTVGKVNVWSRDHQPVHEFAELLRNIADLFESGDTKKVFHR